MCLPPSGREDLSVEADGRLGTAAPRACAAAAPASDDTSQRRSRVVGALAPRPETYVLFLFPHLVFPHLVFESCSSLREEVGWPVPAHRAPRLMLLFLFPHLVFTHPVFDGQPKFGMEVAPRPVLADGLPYATLPGKGGLVFSAASPFSVQARLL